jgi:hypothetical protein
VRISAPAVEFIDEAAFLQFVDEAQIDEVFHFGFGCLRSFLAPA